MTQQLRPYKRIKIIFYRIYFLGGLITPHMIVYDETEWETKMKTFLDRFKEGVRVFHKGTVLKHEIIAVVEYRSVT